ncbi:hypothetical protein GCM10022243_00950 [Saccharothrix violaceirubra]|uniref:Uncharacterized protein n=1 Tax=Saccharothrix violaceirubra TaxID=413306 RepID=A0A7W7T2L4_9PSEU|nr:hypothetical protein [Saccharothrix violaceirubra]MBB4965409.1 hypothetical protein [Saccharothrix violaceirubra]
MAGSTTDKARMRHAVDLVVRDLRARDPRTHTDWTLSAEGVIQPPPPDPRESSAQTP